MKRLSDEELRRMDNLVRTCTSQARHVVVHADMELARLLAELRSLRALLATEMPRHMLRPNADPPWNDGSPFVTAPGGDGRVGIATRWISDDLLPDEAIALGASLIRAGMSTRSGE